MKEMKIIRGLLLSAITAISMIASDVQDIQGLKTGATPACCSKLVTGQVWQDGMAVPTSSTGSMSQTGTLTWSGGTTTQGTSGTAITGSTISTIGDVVNLSEDGSDIVITKYNLSSASIVSTLRYKKVCESGTYNYTNAVTICSSQGYRLPALNETTSNGGYVPSCGSTYTRTSTAYSFNHYMWSGTAYSNYYYSDSASYAVRCVR